jgi:hypothetical protein
VTDNGACQPTCSNDPARTCANNGQCQLRGTCTGPRRCALNTALACAVSSECVFTGSTLVTDSHPYLAPVAEVEAPGDPLSCPTSP